MKIRTLISLMTVFVVFSSGKCEKDGADNTSMEGYIFEGKSFLSTVYFDPNRENTVVEIQVAKFGYYDTLYPMVNENDNSIVLQGQRSMLTYVSKSKMLYENSEHDLKVTLKRDKRTQDMDSHRRKVYGYMAYGMIGTLKARDKFPEYNFDWNTSSDAMYFQEGKFQADYVPNFLKNYQEALQNRNK